MSLNNNNNHKQTLKENLILRGIKLLDFSFIIPIYVLGGIFGATFLDNYIYPYVKISKNIPISKQTTTQLFVNVIILLIINAIASYILRNILQEIPFPLEGVYGFQHKKVKEVTSGQTINFIIMIFSREIRLYIFELQKRFTKHKHINNQVLLYTD